jgi:hypothetical protein
MENIKVFITPEANNALSEKSAFTNKFQKDAIKGLYSIMKSGSSSEHFFLDENNPFGISAIWRQDSNKDSFVLLHKNKPGFPVGYSMNIPMFFEQIKRSMPFPLN